MPITEGPSPDTIKEIKAPPKPVRPKPTPPKPRLKSLETDIGALIITGNLMLSPVLKGDMLDELEVTSLAHAIDDQAQRSPRFRKMVQRALETAGAASLLSVIVIIGGRRAARHGLIDTGWDDTLRAFLAVSNMDAGTSSDEIAAVLAAMQGTPDVAIPEPSTDGATVPGIH